MFRQRATVIIPCHNVEDYVAECLDSVAAQGAAVHHVYCVNNNSSDRTVDVIEKWCSQHPDAAVTLLHEGKPGACAARNAPLQRVETEWIQFLDADDLLMPGKIQQQIAAAASDTDLLFDSSIKRTLDGKESKNEPEHNVMVGLMATALGNTCANLFRADTVRGVGGWDETMSSSQEYDLMFRIYSTGAHFQRLDTGATIIRQRPSGQISQGNLARRKRNSVNLRERMLASFNTESLTATERQRLLGAFFLSLRWLFKADPAHAVSCYDLHLANSDFKVAKVAALPPGYAFVFSLLGFEATERLWLLTGSLHPRRLLNSFRTRRRGLARRA
jgi:hypothetical protein